MKRLPESLILIALLGLTLGSSTTVVAQSRQQPMPSGCSPTTAELQAEKNLVLDFYRPGITLGQLIALIDFSYVQHNPLALKFAQEKHVSDYEEFKQLFTAMAASANPDSKNILDGPARAGGRAPHVVILTADCDLVTAIVQYTRALIQPHLREQPTNASPSIRSGYAEASWSSTETMRKSRRNRWRQRGSGSSNCRVREPFADSFRYRH